ncbi:MAG: hypothetical protein II206_05560 [Bacteroidaceae bacterium]|nr:hypothetical protein [Bacteroidaceae bacterium]
MRVSERNETCFNCRTEAVSHLQNAKTQKCKNAKMQKGAKSIFPIDKENAHILQRKTKKANPCIGAALPQHSPSAMGRQKKWPPIRAAIYNVSSFVFNIG